MANKQMRFLGKVLLKASAIAGEPVEVSEEIKDAVMELRPDYTVGEAAEILVGELFGVEGREALHG